ncbi:MAG: glycerate kinase, partial [Proteobacteria bacterium]
MKLADKSTILIVPDSFKGTLSSIEASQAIASAFESVFPNAKIHSLPLADGGEGSSSLIGKLVGAERREFETFGPLGERITSFLYYDQATFRAYIELAASSGLTLIKDLSCSAMRATTFGTGQLIKSAVASGAREIFLFLGGSATTDGGVGFAKALGYRFLDSNGEVIKSALEAEESRHEFEGEQLRRIAKVLPPPSLDTENVKLTGIADVKNPLFGERGAAYVYGPQKGASREMITELDTGLQNLADVCRRDLARDYSDSPGAGAAGGSGFGVLTFLK